MPKDFYSVKDFQGAGANSDTVYFILEGTDEKVEKSENY
jgi:hypothetical protein